MVFRFAVAMVLLALLAGLAHAGEIGANDFYISTGQGRFPDVAFGSRSEKYLVVWPDANLGRVAGRFVTKDGALSGSVFPISDAGYGALYPAIAYNETDNEFLVVWEQWQRPGGAWCQRVNADTGALIGSNFGAGQAAGAARPGVAWSPATNRYLIVRWAGSETYADLIHNTGAGYITDINVSADPWFSGYPSVSVGSSGGQDKFLVTWDYSPDEEGVIAAKTVNASNAAKSGLILVTSAGGEVRSGSCYDPSNARWLVLYTWYAPAPYGSDQFAQFVRFDGTIEGPPLPMAHTDAFEGETILGCDIAFCPGVNRYQAVYQYYGAVGGIGSREAYANGDFVHVNEMVGLGEYGSHANAADSKRGRFFVAFDSLEGNAFYIRGQLWQIDTDVNSAKPDGPYTTGAVIDIQVAFARKAFVTGTPRLQLETGATDRDAVYISGSGTNVLTFRYTVQAGDASPDLDYKSASALVLNGGTITNEEGAAMNLTLPAPGAARSLGYHKSFYIDTDSAIVTNITSDKADGTYKNGQTIYIQVAFNDTVYVTGSPRLELETGSVDRLAAYSSGTGTQALTFLYLVQNGDVSPDLDVTGINALLLNGGTIKDVANNPANLTVPQPGGAGSLGYNKNLVIDAERPTVASISSLKLDGVYKAGELININVRFREPVTVTGTPQLELETGAVDRRADYTSGSGTDTLVFVYTVQPGDVSNDLDYKSTTSLLLSGGTIRDIPGNLATLTLPAPGAQYSLGYNKSFVIIVDDGSIASAKQQTIGSTVVLGDKVLFVKQTGFGYIEESDRTCGIRVEGEFEAMADSLVCLRGVVRESAGGELYLDCDLVTAHGAGSVEPFGANNRFLSSSLATGLYVTAWGRVLADPVGKSYFMSDGSDSVGVRVIADGPPGVAAGQFVTVRGAAGFDNGRVVYLRSAP